MRLMDADDDMRQVLRAARPLDSDNGRFVVVHIEGVNSIQMQRLLQSLQIYRIGTRSRLHFINVYSDSTDEQNPTFALTKGFLRELYGLPLEQILPPGIRFNTYEPPTGNGGYPDPAYRPRFDVDYTLPNTTGNYASDRLGVAPCMKLLNGNRPHMAVAFFGSTHGWWPGTAPPRINVQGAGPGGVDGLKEGDE
jgi:hypothetical protein